jgi:hypothetical protein
MSRRDVQLIDRSTTPAPEGFAESASGLILPAEHARLRIVVSKDEWRALERAIRKCLGPHRIKFALACDVEGCPDPAIRRVRELDGSMLLRCGHADRVFAAWV